MNNLLQQSVEIKLITCCIVHRTVSDVREVYLYKEEFIGSEVMQVDPACGRNFCSQVMMQVYLLYTVYRKFARCIDIFFVKFLRLVCVSYILCSTCV